MRNARTDVPAELIPTPITGATATATAVASAPSGAGTMLGSLAAAPTSVADPVAVLLRVDGDGRIALGALGAAAVWLSSPQPVTVFTDHASGRIWVAASGQHRCDCDDCGHAATAAPSPAFSAWVGSPVLQSKRRLKLERALWHVIGLAPNRGQVLAQLVAGHDALLLTSIGPIAAGLIADLPTSKSTAITTQEYAA
jgi:hypothetical protein